MKNKLGCASCGGAKKMQKGGSPMTAKEKARIQKIRDYAKKKIDQKLIPTTPAPMPKSIQVPSYSKYKKAMGGEATNKLNKPRGYAKSQTGGSNIGSMIFGVPNAGMTGPNRNSVTETMKAGGSFAPNRAVQASCKGGMVRDENGRCVMARKMKEGGSTKSFPDLNKDGKVTKADILKGRGVIKKTGGATKMAKGGVAHPGFKAVQAGIAAKQGVSKEAAGAILASSTRKASAKAKRNNPRLKKVKG